MVLLAALTLVAQPNLAFVARFYKTGNAKSRFELYISDFDGGNRKLLSTPMEPNFVQWVGKNRLVWTADKGIYSSALSPWKPTLVKKTDTLRFRESRWRRNKPGMPEFEGNLTSGDVYTLNLGTLKLEKLKVEDNGNEIPIRDDGPMRFSDPSAPNQYIHATAYDGFTYQVDGKEVKSEWNIYRAWFAEKNTQLWLVIGSHDSTSGDTNGMMLFEKGKKPRTIFEDANNVDFWPARNTYAYCTSRETQTLDRKEVWTSELHIGDWAKGTNKAILKGLVWVPSVSIRP